MGEALRRKTLFSLGTIEIPALAFIEFSSISRGLYLTDTVLKKAPVQVIASQPVSSGKHVLLFAGDVASVEAAYHAALELADGTVVREILIPGVHEQLAPFLDSIWTFQPKLIPANPEESLGVVESTTLAGAIVSADRALKTARVQLCRMRLGQGIGGKAYYVLMGRQEAIEAALEAAKQSLEGLESFCRVDMIPRPQEEALAYF
ncbi:BMC domain-containing protein [Bdellovibrionota bacterium FG-2]